MINCSGNPNPSGLVTEPWFLVPDAIESLTEFRKDGESNRKSNYCNGKLRACVGGKRVGRTSETGFYFEMQRWSD